jgi:N-dimethylarginine dimethylaminohydrolase
VVLLFKFYFVNKIKKKTLMLIIINQINRNLGIDVIELQADDTLPDSAFVDCIAVICNGTALLARPHLISRRKEARETRLNWLYEKINI